MTSHNLTQSQVEQLVQKIYDDFENARGPFTADMMPEHQVRGGFPSDTNYCLFVTLVASIDKRKETSGERGLWRIAKDLWDAPETEWIYSPEEVIGREFEELIDLFTETPRFNYYEDPLIWYRNCLTFYREYESDPLNLLDQCRDDAINLLEFVRSNEEKTKYLSLTGKKVGALWVRLLDEEIRKLDRIEEVDIPVDSHIQAITNDLLSSDMTKTEVRNFWAEVCQNISIAPVRLDKPLWLIHKHEEKFSPYLSGKIQDL